MIDAYFVNGPWANTYRALEDGAREVTVPMAQNWYAVQEDNTKPAGNIVVGTYEVWYERLDGAIAYRFIPPAA